MDEARAGDGKEGDGTGWRRRAEDGRGWAGTGGDGRGGSREMNRERE